MPADALTLSAQWQQYAADLPPDLPADQVRRIKRAFYNGATAVLALQKHKVPTADVRQEITFFGRQVGTPHEINT